MPFIVRAKHLNTKEFVWDGLSINDAARTFMCQLLPTTLQRVELKEILNDDPFEPVYRLVAEAWRMKLHDPLIIKVHWNVF